MRRYINLPRIYCSILLYLKETSYNSLFFCIENHYFIRKSLHMTHQFKLKHNLEDVLVMWSCVHGSTVSHLCTNSAHVALSQPQTYKLNRCIVGRPGCLLWSKSKAYLCCSSFNIPSIPNYFPAFGWHVTVSELSASFNIHQDHMTPVLLLKVNASGILFKTCWSLDLGRACYTIIQLLIPQF